MTRCLMATHNRATVSQGQIYPLYKYRDELARRFHFEFEEIPHEHRGILKKRLQAACPDIVIVQDRPKEIEDTKAIIDMVRSISGGSKLILMDSVDSTYARQFTLLPHVDLYVKSQLLADLRLYQHSYRDGRIFADFMIRREHLKHKFMGAPYDDAAQLKKVMLGWHLGVGERFERPFADQAYQIYRNDRRDVDICCRVRTRWWPFRDWYTRQRTMAIQEALRLSDRRRVVATNSRISRDQYYEEMKRSKIVVSPFGWGEICGRDFEAIICGCLLVKPAMDHVTTRPDIYINGKTYVAVRWDFSDLVEKCEYYLTHEDEREAIVEEAGRCYAQFFLQDKFLDYVEEILTRLNTA